MGAIAIGRNEGERLRACLESLVRDLDHVVYVDSGSSDNSLAVAQALGVDAVQLDTRGGFTAARARNAGFRRLQQLAPNVKFVQFVDGDCEVIGGWMRAGLAFLNSKPQAAVVCGRRRETHPHLNVYHRLTEMEWETLAGETHSCGGDALFRRDAFEEVGGYRETLIAGEEPELCTRLRKNGWKIWRLDSEMTYHDIRMSTFRQWWRRTVRGGHAYAEVAALHGSLTERHRWRKLVSIWFWALLPFIAFAVWPFTGGASLIATALAYVLLIAKTSASRMRRHRDPWASALLYSTACVLAKWPQTLGSLQYSWNRLRGSRTQLIEYSQHAIGTPSKQGHRTRV
ncbi:glycosyltransferase [Pirellulimonas nuda]|uniref:glycosyltransferase n=1 Tax=Pirellulimonas nuda TaxID=2528009 RepID=UPI0021BC345B|nr:glycosyltransferase [Pirellulimonas nuda]